MKDKIIVCPCGCGSTGEEPSLLMLKRAGAAPKAIIAGSASHTPSVIGAILTDIPMVYGFDQNSLWLIENGDHVKVMADVEVVKVTK